MHISRTFRPCSRTLSVGSILSSQTLVAVFLHDVACRPWPMSYRYVEYFSLHKEDGPRFKVQLREWVPDWVQAGEHAELCACCVVSFSAASCCSLL